MKTKTLISSCLIALTFSASSISAEKQATQSSTVKQTITTPRDAASGLPTGKRQHKPVSLTKPIDKASPKLMNRAGYRLCPDGTMIHPGEKCPEKTTKAGYRLCPDGTMIAPGQKCPEKKKRGQR